MKTRRFDEFGDDAAAVPRWTTCGRRQTHSRPRGGWRAKRVPTTLWTRRAVWLTTGALLVAAFGLAALPAEASRLAHAAAALVGWSLAHWSCPQPVEASPLMTCGRSSGLVPAP